MLLSCVAAASSAAAAPGVASGRLPEGVDLLRDVLGVVLDPPEQRRAPGVLPAQSEEVEAGRLGHAAPVDEAPSVVEDRRRRSTSGRRRKPVAQMTAADVERRAVFEADRRPRGVDGAPVELDAVPAAQARGLEPMSVSRPASRRPIRDSVDLRIRPVASRYQNRSRPRMRWGSGV